MTDTTLTSPNDLTENVTPADADKPLVTLLDLRNRMLAISGGGIDLDPYLPSRMPGRERPFMGEE